MTRVHCHVCTQNGGRDMEMYRQGGGAHVQDGEAQAVRPILRSFGRPPPLVRSRTHVAPLDIHARMHENMNPICVMSVPSVLDACERGLRPVCMFILAGDRNMMCEACSFVITSARTTQLQGAPGFSAKYEAAAHGFEAMAAEAQTLGMTGNKRMQRTSSHNSLVREATVGSLAHASLRVLPCGCTRSHL